MCGRFTRDYTWKQVRQFLDLKFPEQLELKASYNVAPSQPVPVCRLNRAGDRELVPLVWGLQPHWKDPGQAAPPPINARHETAATNPMFREAYRSRRCLIPASGFYEWKKTGRARQPWHIRLLNDPIFCFAGLWERRREGDAVLETFTILTTRSNELVAGIHDRMPVILRPEHFDSWLKGGDIPPTLFEPFPAEEMEAFPVSPTVNSPKNDDPALLKRTEPDASLWERPATPGNPPA